MILKSVYLLISKGFLDILQYLQRPSFSNTVNSYHENKTMLTQPNFALVIVYILPSTHVGNFNFSLPSAPPSPVKNQ